MLTWETLNQKLDYFLDDALTSEKTTNIFPIPLRIESWNWAQQIFGVHTLCEKSTELIIDDTIRQAIAPEDLEYVGMIYDANGELAPDHRNIYTQRRFVEGGLRMDTLNCNWAYWQFGGYIHFDRPIGKGTQVKMDYFASWPSVNYRVQDDGSVNVIDGQIFVPKWAELPLVHLTTATLLQPSAISAAMSNEFKIRIDAGTPLDNPRAQQAREHIWWYQTLLGFHVPQRHAVGVGTEG